MTFEGTILIVDDNLDNLQLLSKILDEQGYEVRVANNGRNAIKSASADPPDLILLDVIMPDLDGFAVCGLLKNEENTKSVPVIFISAIKDIEDRVKCFSVGGVDYIHKPFQIEEVLARVHTHITLARMQTDLGRRVKERTQELAQSNKDLRREITQRIEAEKERERLERQLLHSQKMEAIGQLAGGIAHDFNNILTALFYYIDATTDTVQTKLPDDNRLLSYLKTLRSVVDRAESLTRRLLIFSRRDVVQTQVINLNRSILEMEKILRRLIPENIKLKLEIDDDEGNITGDPGQIEQAIMNLTINAADAMPNGGHITIHTDNVELDPAYAQANPEATSGPHVLLAISDTGEGMDSNTLSRIFEPFFTTKPSGKGTGLGLATTYGIVKNAEGHITVESEVGQGTTFKVYIPMASSSELPTHPTVVDNPPQKGDETVLVCEDDDAVRDLIIQLLERTGYTVIAASSGEEALEKAKTHLDNVPLLITDVIMTGMNGRQLSERLTAQHPHLKTLFISGYTSNIISQHGVLEEGVEFLEKPFNPRVFLARVRDILNKAKNWSASTQ